MNDEFENNNAEGDVYVADPEEGFYDDEYLGDLPGWPKPVGILSIVFGGISLVCGGFGIASLAFLQPMFYGMAEDQMGPAPAVLVNTPTMVLVSGTVSLLLQVLLVIAGITCLSRNIVTRPLHLLYGVAMIVVGAWGTYVNMQWQQAISEWIAQNPDNDWAQQQAAGQSFSGPMTIVMVLLTAAWPIFCLIWFGLVKKTGDDLTGGVLEAAA